MQQRRLAGPVRPDQRHDVARGDREGAVAQSPGAAVAFAEAIGFEHVHGAATPSAASRASLSALKKRAAMPSSSRPASRAALIQRSAVRRRAC